MKEQWAIDMEIWRGWANLQGDPLTLQHLSLNGVYLASPALVFSLAMEFDPPKASVIQGASQAGGEELGKWRAGAEAAAWSFYPVSEQPEQPEACSSLGIPSLVTTQTPRQ